MPPSPDLTGAKAYLEVPTGDETRDAEITSALATETAAQLARCKLPIIDDTDPANPVRGYVDDLIEAVYRRVAHNLALRNLPLGVQASMTDTAIAQTRVGGTDAEVARLEAPYRKWAVG